MAGPRFSAGLSFAQPGSAAASVPRLLPENYGMNQQLAGMFSDLGDGLRRGLDAQAKQQAQERDAQARLSAWRQMVGLEGPPVEKPGMVGAGPVEVRSLDGTPRMDMGRARAFETMIGNPSMSAEAFKVGMGFLTDPRDQEVTLYGANGGEQRARPGTPLYGQLMDAGYSINKPSGPKKPPTTREVKRDGMVITEEWDADAGKFTTVGTGPQFAPQKPEKDNSFDFARKLRDEFTKGAGEFVKVSDAFGRIKASAEDPSPAGDLALVFNYMKVLDPGSTVREGEFATAQNAAGVPTQIRNVFNKISSGEILAPEQRADFVGRAEKLYNEQLRGYDSLTNEYTRLAQRFGVDPANVIVDFRRSFGSDGGGPVQTVQGRGGMVAQAPQQQGGAQGGITDALLDRVREVESSNGERLESGKGALGPYQFLPDTWANPGFGIPGQPAHLIMEEEPSRWMAQKYLEAMQDRYGNLSDALAAYNWGPGNFDAWVAAGRPETGDKAMPKETRDYLQKFSQFLPQQGGAPRAGAGRFDGMSDDEFLQFSQEKYGVDFTDFTKPY